MTPEPRFTLKQLPLPAKLVVALFLGTVGLGYFSAMVQLHMQHSSRNGEPLPSPADVVEIFAGKIKYDPATATPPVSKLEKLVMGPIENAPWNGSGSMAAAFFKKSDSEFTTRMRDGADKLKVMAEREGERLAVKAWINLPDAERKDSYAGDAMAKPDTVADITPDYLGKGQVKIKTILTDRCARCHMKGEAQEKFPLETYEQLMKYMDVLKVEPDANGYIRSTRQTSVEKLTQSTHAHLLSFAMLFGLTGFIFAFTSYPKKVRVIIAPVVLIAQVCDISCWWLARLDNMGPLFAMCILGTGAVVGFGLAVQILASLFDMFSKTGRLVLIILMVLSAGGFGVLYTKAIEPALTAEKAK